jgi:hypothetical protein
VNTTSGYENGYDLPAETAAGQMLEILGRSEVSMVQVSEDQTYWDFESLDDFVGQAGPVELYDYVSDGVVFEEAPAEVVAPVAEPSGQAERRPALFFARGARLPKFRLDLQRDGKDFDMSIRLSGQNPYETALEGAKATKETSVTLYETVHGIGQEAVEAFRGREGSSDKAAVTAITYTCAEAIIGYSHYNDMASDGKLEAVIRQECPSLLQDEVFERVLRHFNADPEAYREKFTQYGAALTQILRAHPARAEFLAGHGLTIEVPEEDGHEQ